jgi:hypothetical protein
MSSLYGNGVSDVNVRLRIYCAIFMGIGALASILYWKEKELVAAEYVDFPQAKHLRLNMIENN